MAERIRFTRVTDARTGEVVQEFSEVFHASDWFQERRGYKVYGRGRTKLGKWDLSVLTDAEAGFLAHLISFLDKDNRIPHADRLLTLTGKSKRQVQRLISRLLAVRAIAKMEGSTYLNPAIAFAGIYLAPNLYRLFHSDMVKIVPQWAQRMYDQEEAVGT